jgi:response regulator RpfG family c-di-GMP phosphodiesterase
MSIENEATKTPMTVLCVDDELNILKSMKRLLYKQDYQLLLAENGAQALELMLKHDVHLIISDMKMPAMSGAQLLENVAVSHPDTYRILLTGYSDIQSTINAVNKGKIHRYLQKPWDNQEILDSIEEGLEKVRLKHENIALQKLIKKQNHVLKEVNQTLEDKVQLRTKQIHLAMHRIERNNSATQKVLYNLISINPNLNGGFANSVSLLSNRIAEHLLLSKQDIDDVTYAALLCEIGLLGLDTSIYSQPFSKLNFNQQQEYVAQTKIAQLVLGPAVHLQTVSDIITSQFEWHNGSGANKLGNSQIPMGAKIISVARDFWRYSLGRITPDCMNENEVLMEMKKYTGTRYDPEVLNVLLSNSNIISDEFIEKPIPANALKPGMVLKYNLFNNAHILVLPEGHVFSEATIAKLIQFEKIQSEPLSLIAEQQGEV